MLKRARTDKGPVVLFIGTQKGLFLACSDQDRQHWRLEAPHLAGFEVYHTLLDPRNPEMAYAATYHVVWGVHVYRSHDGGRTWNTLPGVPRHLQRKGEASLKAIWYLAPGHPEQPATLYAGIDPPGLFRSDDAGNTWTAVTSLNEHPTRLTWEPARGGFAVHSIYVDPADPDRLYAAVSAGGAYRSDDAGKSWTPINRGVRAENLPQRYPESGHNIHRLLLHPAQPKRLYRQCYDGCYRSDDQGDTWLEISTGLPSDFGYAITVDPHDADTVFVIPEESNYLRITAQGKLRVYRSRNGGRDWQALTRGLPQHPVYVTVLREGMDHDGLTPGGLYFGTSSGHLFASRDAGDSWQMIADFLPRIMSVKAAVIEGE
jgi:Uncharacterized protein related to plant photosystem II stability/assembly factor